MNSPLASSIRASIDIGSNSVLGLVLDCSLEGRPKVLFSSSEVTALGQNLSHAPYFLEENMTNTTIALERCLLAFKKFDIHPCEVVATATQASRVAQNAIRFFERIAHELGLYISIITPKAEGFHTAMGVSLGLLASDDQPYTIMDMGGGSTELIAFKNDEFKFKIINNISLPIGVQKLADWGVKNFKEETENFLDQSSVDWALFQARKIIVVDGTLTSLATMALGHKAFSETHLHGTVISWEDMNHKLKPLIETLPPEQLKARYPYLGKRAQTLRYGHSLASSIFNRLGVREVHVSCFGQRHAFAYLGKISKEHLYAHE